MLINAFPQGQAGEQEYIIEEITSSQMWTVPAGVTSIKVMLFGGGGGGSSSNGGGSGFLASSEIDVVAGRANIGNYRRRWKQQ